MPTVPQYDNFQATPNALPSVRLSAPEMPDVAGQQAQQNGQMMQRAGQALGQHAADMAERANMLRVDDALNQAKEAQLKLTHDKEVGFTNLRGINALKRPDDKSLADEYGETLQKQVDQLADGLGNSAQKALFARQAMGMVTSFRGQLQQHEGQEFKTYGLSVSEGIIATATNDMALNWRNPDAVGNAVKRIEAETYRQAQLLGKSAEWQTAAARKMTSNGHKTALLAALESNAPAYADAYLTKHAGQMEADDILALRGHITRERDNQVGVAVADEVVGRVATPRIAPTDTERAFNILIGTESRGKQFGADGKPLTSKAGAIGVAQVMPGTGPEAAKLAGLPWDENRYRNDANYNRALGLAYFQKQLQTQGGDLAKAYAAYNAGPGALQSAVRRSRQEGGDWIQYLPAETRAYVAKNMGEYQGGGGRPAKPTFAELDEQLRADPRLANNPGRYKAARAAAQRRFDDLDKAVKQREDEGLNNALQAVVDNGGNFNGLAPGVRAAIPADKLDRVMSLAEKVSKGVEVETNWQLYYELRTDPAKLKAVNLGTFRDKLGTTEFKQLVDLQQNKDTAKLTTLRSAEDVLKSYMTQAGINPSSKGDAEKAGRIYSLFEDKLGAFESGQGRKATAKEAEEIAARLFTNVETYGRLWNSTKPAYEVTAGDRVVSAEVPPTDRRQIIAALEAARKPVTEEAIRSLYLKGQGF